MDKIKNSDVSHNLYHKLFTQDLSKGQKAQVKIGEKAVEILAKDGLNSFSLDAVARALKTTRSHIAYYFKTTEELLEFIFKLIIETAQLHTVQQLEGKQNPLDLLDGISVGACIWFKENPLQAKCWVSLFEISSRNKTFLELNDKIRTGGLVRLIEIIEQIRPDLKDKERKQMARSIQCLITGELINHFTTIPDRSLDELAIHLKKIARQIVKTA